MATPAVSILIPHLRSPENDKALQIALSCIVANTSVDYELIVDTQVGGVYGICNDMANRAKADYIVFSNTDVFFAPGWITPLLAQANAETIVTGTLVECGAIGVNEANIAHDFGMTPERFDRQAFEAYVSTNPEMPSGRGWYFPSLHPRATFLACGGFDNSQQEFPSPLDEIYWNQWLKAGKRVMRVPSYAYHLQNYSNPSEQGKAVRKG